MGLGATTAFANARTHSDLAGGTACEHTSLRPLRLQRLLSYLSAHAASLTGAGGTAIYPVLSNGPTPTPRKTGDTVNYQAIGSGGGIKQIEAETVTFANTDMPLKPDDLAKNSLVQFPLVIISIIRRQPAGVKPGELVFDGPTLADIYLGKITKWDDPAIKKLNPNVKLPHHGDHRRSTVPTARARPSTSPTISPKSARTGRARSAQAPPSNWPNGVGGKGNAGVAVHVAAESTARSAMSNTPMPWKTTWSTPT